MSLVRTLTDDSGKIEVGVFQDQVPTAASKHELDIDVDEDMIAVGGGGIDSYVIGIQPVLPVGRIVVETVSAESRFSDRPVANAELNPAFALTGIGALVRWTEPGCLIWKLAPLLENAAGADVHGVDAAAKDHLESSRATMQVWALGIRLQEDPCL
jgi:hypothetical protein